MVSTFKVAMSSSPFFCSTLLKSTQPGGNSVDLMSCGPSLAARPQLVVVCQLDKDQTRTASVDVSRRCFAYATASATALAVFGQAEAQAGKRKPPPPEEKKAEEDKGLSAYDQKLLANARRKEALKSSIEAQKSKAKAVATKADKPSTLRFIKDEEESAP